MKLNKFSILLVILSVCLFIGCSKEKSPISPKDEMEEVKVIEKGVGVASLFIEDKGYTILNYESSNEFTLTKDKVESLNVYDELKNEDFSLDDYSDKVLYQHNFIVTNHPLDKYGENNSTKLSIFTCDENILGGYSSPNTEPSTSVFSLSGESLDKK